MTQLWCCSSNLAAYGQLHCSMVLQLHAGAYSSMVVAAIFVPLKIKAVVDMMAFTLSQVGCFIA
jgi:hypothetical protein